MSRNRTRIWATTPLVALLAATLLALTPATAEAARKNRVHRPFQPPTHHRLIDVDCDRVDHDTWRVTYTWRVRGGRYANLGSGYGSQYHRNDNVWRGGRRTLSTATLISGWGPGTPEPPTIGTARYLHYVAPIHNRSKEVELFDTREVNLNCR